MLIFTIKAESWKLLSWIMYLTGQIFNEPDHWLTLESIFSECELVSHGKLKQGSFAIGDQYSNVLIYTFNKFALTYF